MTVTVYSFRQEYPEFKETSVTLCQRKLDAASRRISTTVFGDRTDDGIMLLTAHLLAVSPSGEAARLKPGQTTTYNEDLKQLKREVTAGVGRVT